MISTTEKPEDKREKLRKLREFHQPTLDSIGESNAIFIPKMAYKPYGKTEVHISFFPSEISRGEDLFVEFTSRDLVPEDPDRRLYRWRFNPHFEEEYEKTEPTASTGHIRYLIPVEELEIIKSYNTEEQPKPKEAEISFDLPDATTDLPIDQLTIRDLASILLASPVSHKQWLNEIINKHGKKS
jgi:hypothetical protein